MRSTRARRREWASTFTADGVFDGPASHAEGHDALAGFCDELAVQSPGAMHFTDNHLFEEDVDLMRHRCFLSFQVPRDDDTEIWLLAYEDELIRVDGKWRFRIRRVAPLNS